MPGSWGQGFPLCIDQLALGCHSEDRCAAHLPPASMSAQQGPQPRARGPQEQSGERPGGGAGAQAPTFLPKGPKHSTCVYLYLPRNDCEKDAVTVALANSMTSLYASIAVFSVLGFKAAKDHGRCLDG